MNNPVLIVDIAEALIVNNLDWICLWFGYPSLKLVVLVTEECNNVVTIFVMIIFAMILLGQEKQLHNTFAQN